MARCAVCGAPEEHFDAAPCVEYLKARNAELRETCARLIDHAAEAADCLREGIEAFEPLLEYCRNAGADPEMLDRASALIGDGDGERH